MPNLMPNLMLLSRLDTHQRRSIMYITYTCEQDSCSSRMDTSQLQENGINQDTKSGH